MEDQANKTTALNAASQKLLGILPSILNQPTLQYRTNIDELTVNLPGDLVHTICKILKTHTDTAFDYLTCLSVVDYEDILEINYHLFSYTKRHKMVLKCELKSTDPTISSISNIWRAANWFEREAHDLFGVLFEDHPSLDRLLLPDDFEGNPGLKSYPLHEYKEW
ncbi:MAG: NADH-quinone oxidoreductase subunit C [Chloroflexi bacterium]|jgi:NADH-quinone oxidoreductase subunit C|nr:MAG: NADH-quinone oxidoreductase subunit C [Chloroflexota bacterium]